jgi:small membrane protein
MIIQFIGTGIIVLIILQQIVKFVKDRPSFIKTGLLTFFWSGVLILIWFPKIMGWLGEVTGVGRGVDVLVYLSLIFLFYYVLRQNNKIDQLEKQITKLVRVIARNEEK